MQRSREYPIGIDRSVTDRVLSSPPNVRRKTLTIGKKIDFGVCNYAAPRGKPSLQVNSPPHACLAPQYEPPMHRVGNMILRWVVGGNRAPPRLAVYVSWVRKLRDGLGNRVIPSFGTKKIDGSVTDWAFGVGCG